MKKQLLCLATGIALVIGVGTGCRGEPKAEKDISWLESTATITKVGDNTWKFEFPIDKGTYSLNMPGPEPENVGKPIKVKYNKADPSYYKLIK